MSEAAKAISASLPAGSYDLDEINRVVREALDQGSLSDLRLGELGASHSGPALSTQPDRDPARPAEPVADATRTSKPGGKPATAKEQ